MLAKEIEDMITLKTCSGELGAENVSGGEEESSEVETMGSSFRSIDDLVVESVAACEENAPSPRSISRTTPMPRKSRGAHQYMEDFNNHFGVLAGAIASSLGHTGGSVSPASDMTNTNLESIDCRLGVVDNRFEDMNNQFDGLKNKLINVENEFSDMKNTVI